MDSRLAEAVLLVHLGFIALVIFGAVVTRGRAWLTVLHVGSLIYGIVAELGPWRCPLTLAENYFEARAGLEPYRGPFLLHYLDAIVYPNLSPMLLTICGVSVCVINLLIYAGRFREYLARRTKDSRSLGN